MANQSVVPGKAAGELYIPAIGKSIKLVEWREDAFYDSVQVAAGAVAAGTTLEFFRDLSNKNLQHTNLRTARRIPSGSEFIMSRIGLLPNQAIGASLVAYEDIVKLAYAACLVVKLNDRLVTEGAAIRYQSGLGVTGSLATGTSATGTTFGLATVGVPSAAAAPTLLVSQPVDDSDDLQATLEFRSNAWVAGGAMPTFAGSVIASLILSGFIKKPSTK